MKGNPVIINDNLYIMQGALPKKYNLEVSFSYRYVQYNYIISLFFPFLQTLPYIFPSLALFQIHSFCFALFV